MPELGSSGLEVSPLGLGLAALGRPGYVNVGHDDDLPDHDVEAMRHQTYAVLDAAYREGVRYVDAARSYGRAEEFLAGWLSQRGHAPDEVVVTPSSTR
jgi:aryl-alcohol dehydrogenase-like predicted oxidoreductase